MKSQKKNKFKEFEEVEMDETDRKIVKKSSIKLSKKPYVIGKKNGQINKEPEISIIKNGDLITRIDVKCSCGKVINIECD